MQCATGLACLLPRTESEPEASRILSSQISRWKRAGWKLVTAVVVHSCRLFWKQTCESPSSPCSRSLAWLWCDDSSMFSVVPCFFCFVCVCVCLCVSVCIWACARAHPITTISCDPDCQLLTASLLLFISHRHAFVPYACTHTHIHTHTHTHTPYHPISAKAMARSPLCAMAPDWKLRSERSKSSPFVNTEGDLAAFQALSVKAAGE